MPTQYEEVSKNIQSLLIELGVPCIEKKIEKSPSYIVFHYNLLDISQLDKVEKKIKFISAYMHIDIIYKKSNIGHFSLSVKRDDDNKVVFTDKKFEKLFNKDSNSLNMFVGIDDGGKPRTINLEDMPHILIAGTTGSGKSVALNSLICSLLKNNYKEDLDFVMIDTKRVELAPYKKTGNCVVNTEFVEAINSLEKVCQRMDNRYKYMEQHGLRKISDDYCKIIVVIEELNDLMLVSKKAVEKYIVRIAQLGRACGVHLIIATQRPAVETMTGAIKANIGCRLALQTTSSVDSRNILGHKGAELLKGKGDALLKLPTEPEEIHLQCPYISDEEIYDIIKNFNLN